LMTENTTLKSENSKLKEQLSKLNTEPTKTVINSKPRVFTDESMRNF
jgi:regulator of replication initiation timing